MEITKEIKDLISLGETGEAIKQSVELVKGFLLKSKWLSQEYYQAAIMLQNRFNKFVIDGVKNIQDDKEEARIQNSLLILLESIDSFEIKLKIIDSSISENLLDNTFPFVDRQDFRETFKSIIYPKADEDYLSKVIFIKGEPKSGMSYIEKYLYFLNKAELFQLFSYSMKGLDIPDTFHGVNLAKKLAIDLGFGDSIDFEKNEENQYKFQRFMSKLKEKLSLSDSVKPVCLFLHDFHHLNPIPNDLNNFILYILFEAKKNFPKAVFIFAGLDYEKISIWNEDLYYMKERFIPQSFNNIGRDDFKKCLFKIYENYQNEIIRRNGEDLTNDEYVDGFLNNKINEAGKYDLSILSTDIKKEIFKLKNPNI